MTTDPDAEPLPPFAARYLTHLWRGGYLWGVAGFAALQLVFGRDPVYVLELTLISLALVAVVAVFNLRRRERLATFRPREVSAGETVDAHLPASAVTPPDALQSARDAGVLWGALLVIASIALAWGWVTILRFEPADAGEVARIATVVVGSIAYLILAPSIAIAMVVRARNARLAADLPGALVLTGWFGLVDVITTGLQLRRVTSGTLPWWRARVRSFETVVADHDGIGFWRGGNRPVRQYLLGWESVGPVEMTTVDLGSTATQVGVVVNARMVEDDETGWAHIEFVPTRSSILLAFPYTSHDAISSFARAIEARRPYVPGWFRGVAFGEWRAQIEDTRSAGVLDESIVEDLLTELRGLPDQQRAATAWVPSTLADLRDEAGRYDEARSLRTEAEAWARR